jgi:hypothetical protein|mmetsp:Transcript_7807/g.17460  ORF Transcript_7807/g.17460 Transcript_7807/m.17460 type:complete len:99 (-) Transcript_7807:18-314(-)
MVGMEVLVGRLVHMTACGWHKEGTLTPTTLMVSREIAATAAAAALAEAAADEEAKSDGDGDGDDNGDAGSGTMAETATAAAAGSVALSRTSAAITAAE